MNKTKAELLKEIEALRKRVAALETPTRGKEPPVLEGIQKFEWLTQAINLANDAIFYLDADGIIWWANPKACELTNSSSQDLVTQSLWSLLVPDSVNGAKARLSDIKQGKSVAPLVELQFLQDNTSSYWFQTNITNVGREGHPIEQIVICLDMTTRESTKEEKLPDHEEEIRALLAGTVSVTGQEFFSALVEHLAKALRVRYALVTELLDGEPWRTKCLAMRMGEQWGASFIYPLHDTPCGEAIEKGEAYFQENLQAHFPKDQDLVDLEAVSYKGIRLSNHEGKAIGHLAILDDKPFIDSPRAQSLFKLFAGRASAELERKQTEAALRESEERFRTLVTLSKDPIFYVGTDQEVIYVSPAAETVLGYSTREFTKELIPTILHPTAVSQFEEFWKFYDQHKRFSEEPLDMTWIRKDGCLLHAHQHYTNVTNENGEVSGFLTILHDITNRKEIEDTLLAVAQGVSSEKGDAFYRSLVENLAKSLRVDYAFIGVFTEPENQQVKVLGGWGMGRQLDPLEYDLSGTLCARMVAQSFDAYPREVQQLFPNDALLTTLKIEGYAGLPFFSMDGTPLGIVMIFHGKELKNISFLESILKIFAARASKELQRQAVEQHMKEAYTQLRELTRRLGVAEEEERKRIARELHDEFGQTLTALKFHVSWVSKQVKKDSSLNQKDILDKLSSIDFILDKTVHSVRNIATSLRPSLLDHLGLVAALEWLGKDFQDRTGIRCEVAMNIPNWTFHIQEEISIALYRITQELLTNILRHAQASYVRMGFREHGGFFELEVSDDGVGYVESPGKQHTTWGLVGMRERTGLLGGTFNIHGTPGEGTTVRVQIPLGDTTDDFK